MTQSNRKLLGVVLLLASIVVHSVVTMAIYMQWLEAAPPWLLLVFFSVAGISWFLPASWVIRWMAKPDA